jgi:cobalt-zinc-cadmium efflux system membrane fusion protein
MSRLYVVTIVLLVTLTCGSWAAESGSNAIVALSPESQGQLVLAKVARRQLKGSIDATATIEADTNKVVHVTTRIPGRVEQVLAHLGEHVKVGQPLVILSSEQLGEAKTEYLSSRSLVEIAKQHRDREEGLYAQRIAPQKDALQAEADYDTALAHYRSARERLRLLIPPNEMEHLAWRDNGQPLSDFALTSSISGTVVKRDVTVGSMIDADAEPLTVIDLDSVWVVANIFEKDLTELRDGAEASITVDALPDRNFQGEVTYIADTVDAKTRTVETRIEVPNKNRLLKIGMFAHARIGSANGQREVLAVPSAAIFDIRGTKVVFIVRGDGRFEVRPVQVGEGGEEFSEIVSGVKAGEGVVARGGLVLKTLALAGSGN